MSSCICMFSASILSGAEGSRPACAVQGLTVRRCASNPLITGAASATLGENINGPSVIRAPSWLDDPLGRYYMYFAHHGGKHIRLAYADDLSGPWTVYEPGALRLEQASALIHAHVASPDVHVDNDGRLIWMYFHGPARHEGGQITGVSTSTDGIHFAARDTRIAAFYFRRFRWRGMWYGIAKSGNQGGQLVRSDEAAEEFEVRGKPFLPGMRHASVLLRGDTLLVFYSRGGDCPERILLSTVALTGDWDAWVPSEPIDVLTPEENYEGIEYALRPSTWGSGIRVRELRDPCIYTEADAVYLFYSIAGEMGIAMAELDMEL